MLSANFLPNQSKADVQVFTQVNPADTIFTNYLVWNKPKGKSFCHILCVGGGGAGAGGTAGVATQTPGGGGGSSGCQSSLFIPICYLPDCLYVIVGRVSVGNAGAGVTGGRSTVLLERVASDNVTNAVVRALGGNFSTTAAQGTTGASPVGGAGGTSTSVMTASGSSYAGIGVFTNGVFAGQMGGTGGTAGTPAAGIVIPTTGLQITGGAGGAGLPASGTAAGATVAGAAATGVPRTQDINKVIVPTDSSGLSWINGMFYHVGGAGGSSNATSGQNGLPGGNGGIGSGGGGGGSCLNTGGGTPGRGGDGGSGIVIITCF